jgi:hypothetical protein
LLGTWLGLLGVKFGQLSGGIVHRFLVRLVVGFALLSMLLTSCSLLGKESIPELQEICDGMRSRVVEITSEYPDRDSYSQADYMASLSGESERETLRQKILKLLPYLTDYDLPDFESGAFEDGLNDWRIKEALLLMSNTPAPLVFNAEERQKITSSGADAYEEIVRPKVEFYLGPYYRVDGETEADGCEELDDAPETTLDYDNKVEFQWGYYHAQMKEYVNNYFWILSCQQTGKVEGEKCSISKFVSTPTDSSTLSNYVTDEERAILAEREANAENESKSPPFSNVSAGQACNNLGQLAATENYGTLVCKLVWVGKIKALLWMRA